MAVDSVVLTHFFLLALSISCWACLRLLWLLGLLVSRNTPSLIARIRQILDHLSLFYKSLYLLQISCNTLISQPRAANNVGSAEFFKIALKPVVCSLPPTCQPARERCQKFCSQIFGFSAALHWRDNPRPWWQSLNILGQLLNDNVWMYGCAWSEMLLISRHGLKICLASREISLGAAIRACFLCLLWM